MSLFDDVREFRAAQDANVQDTRDNLFSGLRNTTVTGTTPADTLSATADISALTTSLATTASRLDATLTQLTTGGGGGGNDQFTRTGSNLGTDWTIVDSGTGGSLSTNGVSATWTPAGSSANWVIAKSNLYTAKTDDQISRIVLKQPLDTTSAWLLFTRMNAAQTSYSYGLVRKNYREIGYVNTGTKTVLNSNAAAYDPPPGTAITLEAGPNSVTLGNFLQLVDGNFNQVVSTSTAPLYGASYRNFGFGASIQPSGGVQISPGSVDLWTGFDKLSPPVVGICFEAAPATTGKPAPSATSSLGSFSDFAANTFDTVQRTSDYFSYSASTNTLTVQLPGMYLVTVSWTLSGSTAIASGDLASLWISSTGGLYDGQAATTGSRNISITKQIYMNAGDTVHPAYSWATTPRGLSGTNSSPCSHFTVTKLSPPYF